MVLIYPLVEMFALHVLMNAFAQVSSHVFSPSYLTWKEQMMPIK